jgi:hypothetical protein
VMLADPWLPACVESPRYCALTVKLPATVGARVIEHAPDTSSQPESTADPSENGPLKSTSEVGVETGAMASLTVAVQIVEDPIETAEGEHATVVEDESSTARVRVPELAECEESPS